MLMAFIVWVCLIAGSVGFCFGSMAFDEWREKRKK